MTNLPQSPFHEGELAVQERAGETELAAHNGRILGDEVPAGARGFLSRQPMLVVASADREGRLWASLLLGQPGLVSTADGRLVTLDLGRARPAAWDPLGDTLTAGAEVGLLAIELSTRKRLRINGTVVARDDARVEVAVHEAFPNCPKYIQRRTRAPGADAPEAAALDVRQGVALDAAAQARVARADTVFVASRHAERGLDASHRGGPPGFVHVTGARTLRIPDYPGNGMYNTLGNLAVDPAVGLLVMDFAERRAVQITGRADLRFDEPDAGGLTGGTGRFWQVEVDGWRDAPLAAGPSWQLVETSPYNPPGA